MAEVLDPIPNFLEYPFRNLLLQWIQLHCREESVKVFNAHLTELGNVLIGNSDIQGFLPKAGPMASLTGRVCPVFAEKNPHMNLVAFRLQPLKEILDFREDNILLFRG